MVCTQANNKMTICLRHRHLLGRPLSCPAPMSCPDEPPTNREPKVLSIPGSYWQNNYCGRKTCREFPDIIAIEISQSFVPSLKYHSFFFFMQKIFLNVQSYSNFSIQHLILRCFLMFVSCLIELAKIVYLFLFFDSR